MSKPKTVSLKSVLDLALKDKTFLNALLEDPDEALASHGMLLSKSDLANLTVRLDHVERLREIDDISLLPLMYDADSISRVCAWGPPPQGGK